MTGPEPEKRICIGKICSAHGVKGLVKILPYCEDINLLNGKIFICKSGQQTLDITIKNNSGKHILAQIKDITTPEDAKALKCELYIPRNCLPQIENKDEFYIEDLIGLTAQTHEHKDIIGTLIAVENFGAGDLLEIKPNNETSSPYYIPFHDDYVVSVDLDKQSIMLKDTKRFQMD